MLKLKTKNLTESVTIKNLPTLRQTFIVASFIIIVAFVLAKAIHPNWIYLTLLPGLGLLLFSITGFCPMTFFLQLLPKNKVDVKIN